MKKTAFSPLFVLLVLLLAGFTPAHAQLVSYNGQDGEDPNAVNETPKEIIDRTIHGRISTRLIPYKECSRAQFQAAMKTVGSVERKDMFAFINEVNAEEHAMLVNGSYVINDTVNAEAFLQNYLVIMDPEAGIQTYKGLDYRLNSSKTGFIDRNVYSAKEKWFGLGNFKSGRIHKGGSAMCGNPFGHKPSGNGGNPGGPKKSFGEKPATVNKGTNVYDAGDGRTVVVIENNFHIEGAKIENFGNVDNRSLGGNGRSSTGVINTDPQPSASSVSRVKHVESFPEESSREEVVSERRVSPGSSQRASNSSRVVYSDGGSQYDRQYLQLARVNAAANMIGAFGRLGQGTGSVMTGVAGLQGKLGTRVTTNVNNSNYNGQGGTVTNPNGGPSDNPNGPGSTAQTGGGPSENPNGSGCPSGYHLDAYGNCVP